MSYQVLARKWRPRVFREMVGQEHVLKALINALDHNRLHHAYLFTGTRGVGKTTIARILAKCLNCETGVSSEPCDNCSACREINEGRFVDLIEVDAASRTKVEDTRELLDNVQYAPSRGRFKIYLIDEVHMLSNHSFNALLKTLEEPPAHVKFLLATTDPQKLPVTILSRCLQFNLKNMAPQRIVDHLRKVLGEEMVPFDEPALWLLARSAQGSMRDALSLTDQAVGFGNGKLAEDDVSAMLGTIDHRLIERIMNALISAEAGEVLAVVAEFAEHAPDFHTALGDLIGLLHRIAIAQVVPAAIDNSLGDQDRVIRFARELAAEDVQLFYQIALMGRRDLHLSPDARAGFEMTLLRMLAFKPQGMIDPPEQPLPSSGQQRSASEEGASPVKKPQAETPRASRIDLAKILGEDARPERATAPPKHALSAPSPEPCEPATDTKVLTPPVEVAVEPGARQTSDQPAFTRTAAPVQLADKPVEPRFEPESAVVETAQRDFDKPLDALAANDWLALFYALKLRGVLQSTAANCVLVGVEGDLLNFWLDINKASLFDESHAKRFAQRLTEFFGKPVRVQIEPRALGDEIITPAMHYARKMQAAREQALTTLAADPLVQTLRNELGAVMVDDSVQFAKPHLLP